MVRMDRLPSSCEALSDTRVAIDQIPSPSEHQRQLLKWPRYCWGFQLGRFG